MSSKKFNGIYGAFYAISILIVFVCAVENESIAEHKVIQTNDGKVRGVRKTTLIENVNFYSFKGIETFLISKKWFLSNRLIF